MNVKEARALTEGQGKQFVEDQVNQCLERIYELIRMAAETGKWFINLREDELSKVTVVPIMSEPIDHTKRRMPPPPNQQSSPPFEIVYENLPIIANLRFEKYNGRDDFLLTNIEKAVIDALVANGFKGAINHYVVGHSGFEIRKYYLTVSWARSPSDNLPHYSDDLS